MKALNFYYIVILLFSFSACKKESSSAAKEPAWLKQDLLVYYPMDGNTKDSSGNGLDGIPNGLQPTSNRKNESNKALLFLNGYMVLKNFFNTNFDNDFTIILWAQLDNMISTDPILFFGEYIGLNYKLNSLIYNFYGVAASFTAPIEHKKWNNLAMIRRVDSSHIYLNGEKLKSFVNISPRQPTKFGNSLYFGRDVMGLNPQNYNFNGKLDDIRIYKRALTAEEVKYLYQN
jgi:hypothetical protein